MTAIYASQFSAVQREQLLDFARHLALISILFSLIQPLLILEPFAYHSGDDLTRTQSQTVASLLAPLADPVPNTMTVYGEQVPYRAGKAPLLRENTSSLPQVHSSTGPSIGRANAATPLNRTNNLASDASRTSSSWLQPLELPPARAVPQEAPQKLGVALLPNWLNAPQLQPPNETANFASEAALSGANLLQASSAQCTPANDLDIVIEPPPGIVSAGNRAGDVYTVTLTNNSAISTTNLSLLVDPSAGFSYVAGSAIVDTNDGAGIDDPVTSTTPDAPFTLALTGTDDGMLALEPGQTIVLTFRLATDDTIKSGQALEVTVQSGSPSEACESRVENIQTGRGNLAVFKSPQTQTASFGETVTWTLRIFNNGLANVYDAVLTDIPGAGLADVIIDPPIEPLTLGPDEFQEYTVSAQVASCTDLTNTAQGVWSIGNQDGTAIDGTPVQEVVDIIYELVDGQISVEFGPIPEAPYCGALNATVPVTVSNAGGTIRNLRLATTVGGAEVTTDDPNWTIVDDEWTYTGGAPLPPGTLVGGESFVFNVQLTTDNLCAARNVTLSMEPSFTDACELIQASAAAGTTGTELPPDAPTIELNKEGVSGLDPDVIVVGQPFSYTIDISGVNWDNDELTRIDIQDLVPPSVVVLGVGATGGTLSQSGNDVRLALTDLTAPFAEQIVIDAVVPRTPALSCNPNTPPLLNQATAIGSTCPECTLAVTDTLESYLVDFLDPTINTFTKTATPIELCSPDVNQTVTANMQVGTGITWTNTVYTDTLGAPNNPFNVVAGSINVTIDGQDVTNDVAIVVGPPLIIDFSNISGTLPFTAFAQSADIQVTYAVTAGVNTLGAGDPVSADPFLYSEFNINGPIEGCTPGGAGIFGVPVEFQRGDLNIAISPNVLNSCQQNDITLTVSGGNPDTITDNVEVAFQTDLNDIITPTNFVLGGALATIDPADVTVDFNSVTNFVRFTLPNTFDPNEEGTITFPLFRPCGVAGALSTEVSYLDRCDVPRDADQSFTPETRNSNIILFTTPSKMTLNERSATYRFYVKNGGDAIADSIVVTNTLADFHTFTTFAAESATNPALIPGINVASGVAPSGRDIITLTVPPGLAAGGQIQFDITTEFPQCFAPSTTEIAVTQQCGQVGGVCQGSQRGIIEFVPGPTGLLTSNNQTANLPLCDVGEVLLITKNTSPRSQEFNLVITDTINNGTFVADPAPVVTVFNADGNVVVTGEFQPTSVVTDGIDSELVWSLEENPADPIYEEVLGVRDPSDRIEIVFNVRTSCSGPSIDVQSAGRTLDVCAIPLDFLEDSKSLITDAPEIQVTKQGRNVTTNSELGSDVFGSVGDVVEWQIDVANVGDQRATNLFVLDTVPPNFEVTGVNDVDGYGTFSPSSAEWGAQGGAGGLILNANESKTFVVTGNIIDGVTCTPEAVNRASVNFGCSADQICLDVPVQAEATLSTQPTFQDPVSSGALSTCGGIMTIDLFTEGPPATGVVVTDTLPAGFVYDELVDITVVPAVGTPSLTSAPASGDSELVWIFDSVPGNNPGTPATRTTISFRVRNEQAAAANQCTVLPRNFNNTVDIEFNDTCTASGPYFASSTNRLRVRRHALSVEKTPATAIADVGETVTWTLTIKEEENGGAPGVVITDVVGSGFTNVTATVGELSRGNDFNTPIITPQVDGSTLITWTPAITIPNGRNSVWEATITAEVVENAVHTNTVQTRGGCDAGCFYAIETDTAYVALLEEFTKAPEVQTHTIGAPVVFTVTATLPDEDAIYANTVLTDALPPGLGFVDAQLTYVADGDASTGGPTVGTNLAPDVAPASAQSGDIAWNLGDIDGTLQFTAVITAVIQNVIANQQGVRLANEATLAFEDDGQPYAVTDSAAVDIIEPTLRVQKSVDPISAQPGQTVFYDILLYHDDVSTIPAYNVRLEDLVPDGVRYNPGSWQLFGEPQATAVLTDALSPQLSAYFPVISETRTGDNPIRLRYSASINQNISQGALFTNTATIDYTSLPNDPYSETRDGSGGVNDYSDSDDAIVSIDGIALNKTGPITVTAGAFITYNLSVLNIGPFTATDAVVTDTMPFQLVDGSITASYSVPGTAAGACPVTPDPDGDLVVCPLGEIPVGVTALMTITAQVDPDTPLAADLTNRAQLRVTSQDNDLLDNFAEVDTEVFTESDIGVNKTGPATATAGETVSYTIVLSNTGPSTSRDVDLKDILPPGFTYESASTTQGQCVSAICQLGDVAVGDTITMVVTATVGADVEGTVTNLAEYFGDTADPNPDNNSDTAETTIGGLTALQIVKTDLTDPVFAGNTYLYEIVITNTGPSVAQNVVITDELPEQVTIEGNSPNGCAHDGTDPGGTVTCQLGDMQPGEVRDFLINVRVNTDVVNGETGTNTVAVTTTTNIDFANSILIDDEPTTYLQASGAATDLQLTKSVEPASVIAGSGLVTYTLVVTNAGPSQASAVQVVDAFPREFDFVSATTSKTVTDSLCSNGVTCDLGTMAIGDVVEITLVFAVPADVAAGTYTNTAHVSSPAAETTLVNNTDDAPVAVTSSANLAIRKVADPDPAIPGDDLTYTIIVTNTGPSDAQNVSVTDTLPAGFSADLILSSQGGCAALPCALGTMPAGGNATIIINGAVAPDAGPTLVNSATASADNALDATTTIETTVAGFADLAIDLQSTPTVVSGGAITVTATVFNNGPSVAPNTVVTITLPPSTTLSGNALPAGWTAVDNGDGTVTITASDPFTAGAQIDLPIVVTPDDPTLSGSIEFNAEVTSEAQDANPANNIDNADTFVGGGVADLTVSKTQLAPAGNVTAGELVTYTITITNAGPNAARSVDVKDQLPQGMTLANIAASNDGVCGGTVCQYGTLPAGETRVVTVTARVGSNVAAGDLINTAGVFSANDPDAPADNSASVTTTIETAADLRVTKTDLVDPVAPGGSQLYQIVVTNDGPSDAQNVTITDTLPANVSFSNATPNCIHDGAATGGTVTCALITLAAGEAASFLISVNVSDTASNGSELDNTVETGSDTPDPDSLNNTDTITTAVVGFGNFADLGIVKATGAASVTAGERIAYTLTVTNSGPSVATNARLLELAPAGTSVITMSVTNSDDPTADCSLGGACYVGTVFTTTTAIVTVVLEVDADYSGTALINSASISADQQDPDGTDNFFSVTTPVAASADLGITKVDLLDPIIVGEVLPYQIVITNAGPSDAQNVVITDTLDANVSYVGGSPGCVHDGAAAGGEIVCQIGTVAAGDSVFVLIDARVDASLTTSTTLTNNVALGSSTPDANPDNNSDTEETLAELGALVPVDLAIGKNGPATATAGEQITYTLTVANNGDGGASNVQVVDALPLGLTLESIESSQGLCNDGITCDLGDLVVTGTASITIVARVDADQTLDILNEARVSASNPDSDPTNNEATLPTAIETAADLGILKTATPITATPGGLLTYQIVITNAGPSDAQNVVVTDVLPADLTGATFSASQGSCDGTGACSLGVIPAGGQAVISIVGTVAAGATADLVNTATVSSDTNDPNETNDESTVTTPLTGAADLQLDLTSTPTVDGGGTMTVTASVFNVGPSNADGTVITVTLPPSTTLSGDALPAGWTATDNGDGTVTITASDLLTPGVQVDLPLTVTVDENIEPGTSLEFTGETTSETSDPNPFNNTANADTTVISGSDLALDLQSVPTVGAGDSMTVTATVFNNGPLPADGTAVTITLPASTTIDLAATNAALPAGWTATDNDDGTVTIIASDVLAPDAIVDLPLVVNVDPSAPSGTSIQFKGEVSSDSFDPTPSNNVDNADTTIIAGADLNLDMTSTPTVLAGEQVTATVHLANDGSLPAAGTVITVTLPPSTTFDLAATNAALPAGWTATDNGDGTVTIIADDDVPAGADVDLPIIATVDPNVEPGTSLEFTSTVGSETPDTNLLNNGANTDTSVIAGADLAIAKSGAPDPVIAGELITYTLLVSNAGPSVAEDVVVIDSLPVSVTATNAWSIARSLGTDPAACVLGTCALGDMPAGEVVTITLQARVESSVAHLATITNTALVQSPSDANTSNNQTAAATLVARLSDLGIVKTATPDPASAGGPLSYEIVVTNRGSSDAAGVTISDTLPAGFTLEQILASAGDCAALPCDVGTVAAGAQASVTLIGTVSSTNTESLVNTASVTASTPLTNTLDDTVTITTALGTLADVAVSKVDSADPVRAGESFFYTITVENRGSAAAAAVVITDTLPVSVTFDAAASTPGMAEVSPGVIVWPARQNPLPAGASEVYTLGVTVDPNLAQSFSLVNNVAVGSSTPDADPDNNVAVEDTEVNALAQLAIAKTSTPNPVVAGEQLTYTIVVTNNGPSTATDVRVIDAIPPQTTLVSTSATDGGGSINGVCDAGVICLLGSLGVSQTATVTIVVDVAQTLAVGDVFTNTATVFSEQLDPPLPITATEATIVTGLVDLSIEKQDLPDPVGAGETLRYQLLVANVGPSDAFNVVITDTLDVRTSFLQATPGFGCNEVVAGTIACGIPVLQAGATAVIELDVTVAADLAEGTVITNTVVITSDSPELNLANNSDVEPTTITAGADLQVRKLGPATVNAGDFITYTVLVDNLGPSPAPDVVITDAIPVGLVAASVTVTPSAGCTIGAELVCALGTIGVMETVTLVVSGQVDPSVAADSLLINTVRGTTSARDPNPLNNEARVETVVGSGADLEIRKDGPTTVTAGEQVTYTIVMTNNGPSTAHFVDVKDTLPDGVALDNASIERSLSPDPAACAGAICQAGDVPVGEVITITVVGDVDPTLPDGTVITNTATAFSQTPDPDQSNNVDTATSTVESRSRLTVSKRDLLDPITQGALLLYSIVVTNAGPSAAADVVIMDVLPPEVVYQGNATECVEDPLRTLTCAVGSIAAGASRSIFIAVRVEPWVVGGTTFENSVNITSTTPLTDSILSDTEPTTVEQFDGPPADMGIEKLVTPAGAKTGETVTYTLIISNNGPATATDVTVVDALPDGLRLISVTSSQGFCNSGVTCLVGTMPFGGVPSTATITMLATVLPSVVNGAVLTNIAAVNANQPDPNPTNDLDEVVVEIGAEADLVLTKTSNAAVVAPGNLISYEIEIVNNGPANAVNAVVVDQLPSALLNGATDEVDLTLADSAFDCTLSGATFTCLLGTLEVGKRVRIPYNVRIPLTATGSIRNVALANSQTPDPVGANNEGVVDSPVVADADLSIAKAVLSDEVQAGSILTYTLTVHNAGPSAAVHVVVRDELPLGVRFIDSVPPLSDGPVPLEWRFATMQPGETQAITLTTRVDAALDNTTLLRNEAGVSSATPDSNPNNNGDEALSQVFDAPLTDLLILKVANQPLVVPGGPITYTLTVTNNGPDVATDVMVTDLLPSTLRFRTGRNLRSGTPCYLNALDTPECVLGTIGVNQSVSIQLVAEAAGDAGEAVENVATVDTVGGYDFNSDNNRSTAIVPVIARPSAIGMLSLSAMATLEGIRVDWVTAFELDSQGFYLWRSTEPDWINAKRLNDSMVLSGGAPYGDFYGLLDRTALPQVRYYYWIEEVSLDGTRTSYGPVEGRLGATVYLPVISK